MVVLTVYVAEEQSIPIFLPPTFSSETTTSVTVSWEEMENVTLYSASLNGVETYRGTDHNCTLNGLEPGMPYFVQVGGMNRAAVGVQSDPLAFMTPLDDTDTTDSNDATMVPTPAPTTN